MTVIAVLIADHIAKGDLAIEIRTRNGDQRSLLASTQIVSGNADLSAHTQEQAGSLEETALVMDELTAAVQRHADHAQHAASLTRAVSLFKLSHVPAVQMHNGVDDLNTIDACMFSNVADGVRAALPRHNVKLLLRRASGSRHEKTAVAVMALRFFFGAAKSVFSVLRRRSRS